MTVLSTYGARRGESSQRRPGPVLAAAALAAILPVACASNSDRPPPPGDSLVGNYLAGRHAQTERELGVAADYYLATLEQDPDNEDLLRRTFLVTVLEGRSETAVRLARRIVDIDSKAPFAALAVIVDDIRIGDLAEARERLESVPNEGFNAVMKPLLGAWIQVGMGSVEEAHKALEPLSARKGFQGIRDLHAALIHEIAGSRDEAEKLYRAVEGERAGLSLRLTQLLGGLYERAEQPDMARATYGDYIREHPMTRLLEKDMARVDSGTPPPLMVASHVDGVAEALFGVASSLRRQNARETALVLGRLALHAKPDFPMVQILVADILEADERLESANTVYEAIDRDSPFAWAARLRIASNLDKLDRPDQAERQLRAMAAENPALAEPLIDLGDILRRRERFAEAVLAYDEAFARIATPEPQHWTLLYARGIALERSKQWPRAEADFLKALEFQPDQPYVLNYLGYSWVEQRRHLDQALEMIKKAVRLRPNDGYIVDSLGWVYYQLGDFEAAVKELERAAELRPEDPVINDHLGDAYWKVGRRREARFQWHRAMGLDPEPDVLAAIQVKLAEGLQAETVQNE